MGTITKINYYLLLFTHCSEFGSEYTYEHGYRDKLCMVSLLFKTDRKRNHLRAVYTGMPEKDVLSVTSLTSTKTITSISVQSRQVFSA